MNQNLSLFKMSALLLATSLGVGHLFVGPRPDVVVHVDSGLKVGMTAPNFRVQDLDGRWVESMPLRRRGEMILLVFFSLSSPEQAQALGNMNAIETAFGARSGFHVLGISSDEPAALRAFARRSKISFPVLLDSDRRVHKAYDIGPASSAYVLIGGNGALFAHPRLY
jgi:peroxiredoxin